jgi:hypothetical protein
MEGEGVGKGENGLLLRDPLQATAEEVVNFLL